MNKTDFDAMLGLIETAGIPITYYSYPENEAPFLPYAVYFFSGTRTETADNTNHIRIDTLVIELYTRQKDFGVEQDLEQILSDNELIFDKQETYLNTEGMFEIIYTMEDISIWDVSDTD